MNWLLESVFRAVRRLGEASIVARVMEVSDASSASLALIENLQREDLNPIDEALGFAACYAILILRKKAAARAGKGRATVANAMRLLTLEPEVQDLLRQRLISSGHAKVLLGLSSRWSKSAWRKQLWSRGWGAAAEERVRRLNRAIGYQAEGQLIHI